MGIAAKTLYDTDFAEWSSQTAGMLRKVKQTIQPERDGTSWRLSIADARQTILDHIEDSPSLRKYLRDNLQRFYRDAVELALIETEQTAAANSVPKKCPWPLDALLNGEAG